MSEKTGSLLAVAAAPLVAAGLIELWMHRRTLWRIMAAMTLLAGLANAAVYELQFAYCRATGTTQRSLALPAPYVQALDYVRQHSPLRAVVIDPYSDAMPDTVCTTVLTERRVWLRRELRYLSRLSSDPDLPTAGAALLAGYGSALARPVELEGQTLGVLEFYAPPPAKGIRRLNGQNRAFHLVYRLTYNDVTIICETVQ